MIEPTPEELAKMKEDYEYSVENLGRILKRLRARLDQKVGDVDLFSRSDVSEVIDALAYDHWCDCLSCGEALYFSPRTFEAKLCYLCGAELVWESIEMTEAEGAAHREESARTRGEWWESLTPHAQDQLMDGVLGLWRKGR